MGKWFLKFASYESPNDIFELVKSGKKIIETRPRNKESSKDYSNIKPGEILVMQSNDTGERIEKTVTFLHKYESVEDLAESEPVNKILPDIKSPEQLIEVFEELKKKWGKRYAEKLEKYGIAAIGFK
ncbi:hypothetical protein JXA63_04205 [Candidatus Woesebacteria bacterium]|nr:hypothetical protein [Candidatus Woesebacteria bacterium]